MHLFKEFGASNVEKEVFSRIVARTSLLLVFMVKAKGGPGAPLLVLTLQYTLQ